MIIEVSRPVCGPLAAIAQDMEVIHPDARTKPPTPKTKQTNAGEEKPFPLNPGMPGILNTLGVRCIIFIAEHMSLEGDRVFLTNAMRG